MKPPGPIRFALAFAISGFADLLQIAIFPLFAGGISSPADDALDLIVAGLLTYLLGWHWAFLPTIAAESVPGANLFPFWFGAVLFVRSQQPALPGANESHSE